MKKEYYSTISSRGRRIKRPEKREGGKMLNQLTEKVTGTGKALKRHTAVQGGRFNG